MHSDAHGQVDAALYVVATPLGNLRDITLRALDVLGAVDAVAAEDTRVTRRLMSHYGLRTPRLALHQHNEARAAAEIVRRIQAGEAIAYVTDAGTPGISDPGAVLVARVRAAGLRVVPVPGPSAVSAALSAAGVSDPHFLFYGFLPAKTSARRDALAILAPLPYRLVFFEAPQRIGQSLADMAQVLGPEREVVIARELTKVFENFHSCALADAPRWLSEDPNRSRGEFVLIVQGAAQAPVRAEGAGEHALEVLLRELPLKQSVQLAAQISGARKNALYARALELKRDR